MSTSSRRCRSDASVRGPTVPASRFATVQSAPAFPVPLSAASGEDFERVALADQLPIACVSRRRRWPPFSHSICRPSAARYYAGARPSRAAFPRKTCKGPRWRFSALYATSFCSQWALLLLNPRCFRVVVLACTWVNAKLQVEGAQRIESSSERLNKPPTAALLRPSRRLLGRPASQQRELQGAR